MESHLTEENWRARTEAPALQLGRDAFSHVQTEKLYHLFPYLSGTQWGLAMNFSNHQNFEEPTL